MKNTIKFAIAAILSLCIGVGFAAPLIVDEIIPYPRVPQGPTAEFSVDVVYANFDVQDTGGPDNKLITYQAVLNITNLADISAKLGSLDFTAAQNIIMRESAVGGHGSFSGTHTDGATASSGHPVPGLWLDNEWLNVTWIPGSRSNGTMQVMKSPWGNMVAYVESLPTTAPDLPANASETGFFIEGMLVKELSVYHAASKTATTWQIVYINGTWVNVTGRISVEEPTVSILELNVFGKAFTYFLPQQTNSTSSQSQSGMTTFKRILCSGIDDFDNTFAPRQSRLIQVTGYANVSSYGDSIGTEEISFYTGTSSRIYEQPVNGTFYDTQSDTDTLKTVTLTQIGNQYVYNQILGEDEVFVSDQWGVEVFIRPRS